MTGDTDPEYTDWLANGATSYGYGYTKEQALAAMAVHSSPSAGEEVVVDLVQHRGGATTGPGGWRVDEFVSGERVTIPGEAFDKLRDAAIKADARANDALHEADVEEIE